MLNIYDTNLIYYHKFIINYYDKNKCGYLCKYIL